MTSTTRNEDAVLPSIEIELSTSSPTPGELSLTLPFVIKVKLHRALDNTQRPCIFRWELSNALAQGDLLVFHETTDGLRQIHIEHPMWDQKDVVTLERLSGNFIELSPGSEIEFQANLPLRYREQLKDGEAYRLQWPGSEVSMWEWGSLENHIGSKITDRRARDPPEPSLIIGSRSDISIKVKEEPEPWPDRPVTTDESRFHQANQDEQMWRGSRNRNSPPPLDETARCDGAPLFSMALQGPTEWLSSDPKQEVLLTVTHERSPISNARPVTFRTATFWSETLGGWPILYQRRKDDPFIWEQYHDDSPRGFMLADDPPIPIFVGDDSSGPQYGPWQFVTLYPGESWRYAFTYHGTEYSQLPEEILPGEQFKLLFKGARVDWWDWGTMEEHRNTRVVLNCVTGAELEEPRDNGGRPALVLPGSNVLVCTWCG